MMIRILLVLLAVLLCALAYFLYKRQSLFLSLLPETTLNIRFLKQSALGYLLLAIASVCLAFWNQRFPALILLAVLFLFSTIFSIQFAKRMR